jgi:hypothetical protein
MMAWRRRRRGCSTRTRRRPRPVTFRFADTVVDKHAPNRQALDQHGEHYDGVGAGERDLRASESLERQDRGNGEAAPQAD